jgi:hypothetical protein
MDEGEQQYRHILEQDYEEMSTYEFITFVQGHSDFLRQYINNKYRDDPDEVGYLTSFINICQGINVDVGDEGEFDTYRPTIEPLMEWATLWAEDMNKFYNERREQQVAATDVGPKGVTDRTRSKLPVASEFEIPPNKRGRNAMTLEPTKQEAVRIKLSDGKEYTYGELKHMIQWNKNMTPHRHPYTEEDKQKIKDLIEFATKGGKTKKTKKMKKTRKQKKTKKSKKTRKRKNKKNKSKRK